MMRMETPQRRLPGFLSTALNWVLALPRWVLGAGAAMIAAGLLSFVFFLGFVSGERSVGPHVFFGKVTNKLDIWFFSGPVRQVDAQTYNTALLRLNSDVAIVDTGRDHARLGALNENGGGLASFGDDVLLLPYNGKIYAASSSSDLRETTVQGPDNHRDDYQALAGAEGWEAYEFDPSYLRYNDLMAYDTGSEQGLIASYTEFNAEETCYTNTLAKLVLPAGTTDIDQVSATADDWQVFFRTEPCLPFKEQHLALEGHMAGGRLAFAAPSTVYLASGDFHLDGMRSNGELIAQTEDAMYGKVLSVDVLTGEGEILSMGHRNAQGITVMDNGDVIIVEHGPQGGDELNIIEAGANYGWPLESYGTTYTGAQIPDSLSFGRHDTFTPPVFAWMPSVATSGLTRVEGFHEHWDGDLLVTALIEQAIYRVRLADNRPVYAERIEIGSRLRYIHQHTDGRLVLWTDLGELIFLTPEERVDEGERLAEWLSYADYPARVKREMQTAIGRCAECHSLTAGDHERAPSLAEIYGDPIASTSYEGYSDGLQSRSGSWTRENLIAFLEDPQGFAPGTTMAASNLPDRRVTEAIVDYLQRRDEEF